MKYLKPEHLNCLSPDSFLRELYEFTQNIDIVGEILKGMQGNRSYIPVMSASFEEFWRDIIEDNFDKNGRELQSITGLPHDHIKKIKRDLVDKHRVQIKNQVRMFDCQEGKEDQETPPQPSPEGRV